jgi:putative membrane protein
MLHDLIEFLARCAITALSLWLASFIFHGISFRSRKSLLVAAILLGIVNAVIRPAVIVLTIPLTLITFGLFLLVINALMMLLVSALVPGFKVSGFWTAFFASIFVTVLSLVIGELIFPSGENFPYIPENNGVMI